MISKFKIGDLVEHLYGGFDVGFLLEEKYQEGSFLREIEEYYKYKIFIINSDKKGWKYKVIDYADWSIRKISNDQI